jgi:cation transport ATPase
MATSAVLVHQVPGRIRLRVEDMRGDADYFSALSKGFSGLDVVQHVKVNPSTASIVIEFSDSLENLARKMRQHGMVIENQHMEHSERPRRPPRNADMAPLNLVSGRNINAMFMLSALMVAVGLVQTYRGRIFVPAISAFWYAMNAFRESGKSRS